MVKTGVWLRGAGCLCVGLALLLATARVQTAFATEPAMAHMQERFEIFKREASDEALYRFLYAMPKGGDLHNHLSGSLRPEWLYEIALAQRERGYRFYTRVRINNCRPYGGNAFGPAPYLLLFLTSSRVSTKRWMPASVPSIRRLRNSMHSSWTVGGTACV